MIEQVASTRTQNETLALYKKSGMIKAAAILGVATLLLVIHPLAWPTGSALQAQAAVNQAPGQPTPGAQAASPTDAAAHVTYLPMIAMPPAFAEPFPHQSARRQSLNAYLAWTFRSDLYGDSYRFDIYLENDDETPDQLIGTTAARFLEPPFTFELNTNYYWQVIAVNEQDGNSWQSPVWAFHTEDLPYPPPVGEMISIPATEFMMGCDSNNPAEYSCEPTLFHVEIPLHLVRLDAYAIDKYEVTNGEYKACVDAGACNRPRRSGSRYRDEYYGHPEFTYHPVLYVSHQDAKNYCEWAGKRLPTEAEWELAARGAVDTRTFPWGDEAQDCTRASKNANNDECLNPQDMLQVGSYPRGASPFGLMDVAGNAFEWVEDRYDVLYYSYSPTDNPPGPDFSRTRSNLPPRDEHPYTVYTIRGGANTDNAHYMRTAHRHWGHHGEGAPNYDSPLYRTFRVGFRCAKSAESGGE